MTALGVVSEGVEGGCFTFNGVFCDVFSEGGAVQGSAGVLRGGVVGGGGGFITIFVRFSASSGLFLVTIGGFFRGDSFQGLLRYVVFLAKGGLSQFSVRV